MTIRTNMDAYLEELNYDFETSSYSLTKELISIVQADFIDNGDTITLNKVGEHIRNPLFNTPLEKCEWK